MSQRVAVSPLGGVGFRPVEVANPKGGSPPPVQQPRLGARS